MAFFITVIIAVILFVMEEIELFFFYDKEKVTKSRRNEYGNTSRRTEGFIWYKAENCV